MKTTKKIVAMVLVIASLVLCLAGCKKNKTPTPSDTIYSLDGYTEDTSTEAKDYYYVAMAVKNHGIIIVELDSKNAPKTVANFVKLVREDFYDGLTFHRVIEGFMIQGGGCIVAPEGSKDYFAYKEADSINGEFTSNGFVNNLTHVRGVISMARAGAPSQATNEQIKEANNSASSQFFIVHETGDSARSLNGDYATFGYVLAGMDVVDAIATCLVLDPNSQAPVPVQDVVIESITFVEPK